MSIEQLAVGNTGTELVNKFNNNFAELNGAQTLVGVVNPNLATTLSFGGVGQRVLSVTESDAIKYYLHATTGIASNTYSVRVDASADWETITYSDLINFMAGSFTTATYSHNVGVSTSWQLRFEAVFGASAISKDYPVEIILSKV